MSYKGKYKVKNPEKYKGDPTSIIWRSLWERKYMKYLDGNPNILELSSEEFFIWYKSPIDNRQHRYFPDFFVKEKYSDGSVKKYLVEIKPKKQTAPPTKPQRQTKRYISEVYEYAKNQAKWEAAKEYCEDRGWTFKIITEHDLNIKG
jgi:hypothetical protein